MNQYLLSVHSVDGRPPHPEDQTEKMLADVRALNEVMKKEGIWVFAGGLHGPSSATVVRAQAGEIVMSDGPFAEAKEQLAGFWIIEAPDLDAALAWAAKATVACQGPIEVRPFHDPPGQE